MRARACAVPREGDQLLLDLRMPWNGVSPRYLTRVHLSSKFARRARAARCYKRFGEAQLELFPEGTSFSLEPSGLERAGDVLERMSSFKKRIPDPAPEPPPNGA